jgi:hypothetical protein
MLGTFISSREKAMKPQGTETRTKEDFKAKRIRQLLLAVPLVAAVVFLIWSEDRPGTAILGIPSAHLTYATIAYLIFYAVFSIVNWRCPSCRSYLGKGINPRFCSKCGAQLQ